jgi:hypothetical protein
MTWTWTCTVSHLMLLASLASCYLPRRPNLPLLERYTKYILIIHEFLVYCFYTNDLSLSHTS